MRFRSSICSVLFIALLVLGLRGDVYGLASLTSARLKRLGLRVVSCPHFIAYGKTGLATSVLSNTSLCIKSTNVKKLKNKVSSAKLVIDGSQSSGAAFSPIVNSEGDVQTQPFRVSNYPAIISYQVSEANTRARFQITVMNAATGREVFRLLRLGGGTSQVIEGDIAFNNSGTYYLKINGYGTSASRKATQELQPNYSVSMNFLESYTSYPVSRGDMRMAGMKSTTCPAYIIDTTSNKMYRVGSRFICSRSALARVLDAGFIHAPLNLGLTMFLARNPSNEGIGTQTGLPFRILRSTPLDYSVDDPSEGSGSTDIYLNNLVTSKTAAHLVSVTGNIQGTTTYINVPGDYFLRITTSPHSQATLGDIEWKYELHPE